MKFAIRGFAAALGLMLAPAGAQDQARINPTDPQLPICSGTYIPLTELDAYAGGLTHVGSEVMFRAAARTIRRLDTSYKNWGTP